MLRAPLKHCACKGSAQISIFTRYSPCVYCMQRFSEGAHAVLCNSQIHMEGFFIRFRWHAPVEEEVKKCHGIVQIDLFHEQIHLCRFRGDGQEIETGTLEKGLLFYG